jgi:ATP-binding cassette subfamily F protein 3
MLADALNKYQGSFILVSHDRYFVAKIANKIWEIIDGKINEFIGTYDEYVAFKEKKEALAKEALKNAEPIATPKVVVVKKEEPKLPPAEHKEAQKKLKQAQNTFRKIEDELNTAQMQKTELENKLGDPAVYADKNIFLKTEQDYASIQKKVEQLQAQYEVLFEQLLELEN